MNVVFCIFLLLPFASSKNDFSTRIVGGKIVKKGEAPYQVAIQTKKDPGYMCGGAIISERFILTAAHCIISFIKPFFIVAGTNNYKKPGAIYHIEKYILHCDFDKPYPQNDIALLRLNSSIIWNRNTQPIKIEFKRMKDGDPLLLTGWGRTQYAPERYDENLQKINVSFLPYSKCKKMWNRPKDDDKLYIGHLCTYPRKDGSGCYGDSGSPMVNKHKRLVGIANLVRECAGIIVSASVIYHIDWINKALSEKSDNELC